MGPIAAMALILLVGAGIAVTVIYSLAKYLRNFPPSQKRMQKEIQQLKSSIATWFSDLVPWDSDEMERLSFNKMNQKITKGLSKSGRGIFTSIYHEPMIAYAFKKYSGKGNNSLVYAKTSHHEYAFRIKGEQAEIWMDSQPLGTFRADGTLVGAKTNKEIARLERPKERNYFPVVINNKELAALADPDHGEKVNPRAFELLHSMSEQEESVLLSMAILEMIRPEVDKL